MKNEAIDYGWWLEDDWKLEDVEYEFCALMTRDISLSYRKIENAKEDWGRVWGSSFRRRLELQFFWKITVGVEFVPSVLEMIRPGFRKADSAFSSTSSSDSGAAAMFWRDLLWLQAVDQELPCASKVVSLEIILWNSDFFSHTPISIHGTFVYFTYEFTIKANRSW